MIIWWIYTRQRILDVGTEMCNINMRPRESSLFFQQNLIILIYDCCIFYTHSIMEINPNLGGQGGG